MGLDPTALIIGMMVFGAVMCGLLGLTWGGQSAGSAAARQRLEGFKRGGVDQPDEKTPNAPFGERVIAPMMRSLSGGFGNLLPKSLLAGVEKTLIYAGEPMNLQGFLTMATVSTGASVLLAFLIVFASGVGIGPITLGLGIFIVVIGFYMPFYLIGSRAKSRQHAIIKSLPDAFDLITTCVEAGLGLDAALARVAEKVEGPFADELTRALRDIALGKSRRDALKELGDRTGVPDLITFTNAVIQAEAMGSSVGAVLRVQADQLRVKRRQRAEKAAYQAPVKMLFPLVMCIFPTLFIVILGPAIITIKNGFG
jgi:tight adherence protein C